VSSGNRHSRTANVTLIAISAISFKKRAQPLVLDFNVPFFPFFPRSSTPCLRLTVYPINGILERWRPSLTNRR
jgi:hypothetical protein